MIAIGLTLDEVTVALDVARQRNDLHSENSNKRFHEGHTDLHIHYVSALAELAWEKATGWPLDRAAHVAGDGGVDFASDGRTYQMKARDVSVFEDPDLLCRIGYDKADRYILADVHVNTRVVNFIGWCTGDELRQEVISLNGKGERYIVRRSMLRRFPRELVERIYNEYR